MSGETNHYYLQNSSFLDKTTINGYDMYDAGVYPAITPCDNLIIGELYHVPIDDMSLIDMLEAEGILYIKKCEKITDTEGKTAFAFVYIYNKDTSNLMKIASWKEYV